MKLHNPRRNNDQWIAGIREREHHTWSDLEEICRWACRKRLGEDQLKGLPIEDIARDIAFEKIVPYVMRGSFKIDYLFTGYVISTVNNHIADYLRDYYTGKKVDLISIDEQEQLGKTLAAFVQTRDDMADERRKALFTACIECFSALNARSQLITSWYVNHLGPSWIAPRLDPPSTPGAVSKRWFDIRRTLKECLHDKGFMLEYSQ